MQKRFFIPICVLLLVSLFSCSNQEEFTPDKSLDTSSTEHYDLPQVKSGRLVFTGGEHITHFVNNESNMQQLITGLKQKGFVPLREKENIVQDEYAFSGFILSIYNKEGELQVGDELILIDGLTQYIVDNNDESLFQRVKEEVANGGSPSYKGVKVHHIEKKAIPLNLEIEGNEGDRRWSNAHHQYEFSHNGTRMKFVYEAYMTVSYLHTAQVIVNTGVIAKLEWLHGNTWKPAGENVTRTVQNLSIQLSPANGYTQTRNYSYLSQGKSGDLYLYGPSHLSPEGESYYGPYVITASGYIYSEIRQSGWPNYSWGANCSWGGTLRL